MTPPRRRGDITTVAGLPSEDIVVLAAGTPWQVPWELMMLGPFVSCGLLDGTVIRHLTVPAMVASAVRRHATPASELNPDDYVPLPVLAPQTALLDAASMVASAGWDLAVVMSREPRVITARSVYRAVVASAVSNDSSASGSRCCSSMGSVACACGRDETDLVHVRHGDVPGPAGHDERSERHGA